MPLTINLFRIPPPQGVRWNGRPYLLALIKEALRTNINLTIVSPNEDEAGWLLEEIKRLAEEEVGAEENG